MKSGNLVCFFNKHTDCGLFQNVPLTSDTSRALLVFFTYSESPSNSLLDKGLTCKNYSMGLGVMTV